MTVALNGDGGDESFAGYERYTTNLALAQLDRLPLALRRAAPPPARDARRRGGDQRRLRRGWGASALASALDRESRYVAAAVDVHREPSASGCTRPSTERCSDPRGADETLLAPWRSSSATDLLDQLLDVDVNTYLPDDLLVKIDIATMAYSLEGRSPLLDHELMELAASLPPELKAAGTDRKRVAARGAAGLGPGRDPRRSQAGLPAAGGGLVARGAARATRAMCCSTRRGSARLVR